MTFTRIRKPAARKLFNEGKAFWIVARNMRPECGLLINDDFYENVDCNDFEKLINSFTYYNCDHERGYYPAFYTDDWEG